jgi:hypothetical protein
MASSYQANTSSSETRSLIAATVLAGSAQPHVQLLDVGSQQLSQ